jgi:hypothetical protein
MKSTTNLELQKYSGYGSRLRFLPSTINTVRVQLPDGSTRELHSPVFGRDFISGVLEDSRTRGYFRKSSIRSVEFLTDDQIDLPELSFTRKAIGEQLLELQLPAQFRISYRDGNTRSQKVRVVGLYREFLVSDFYLNPSIPLAALSLIEVECV